MSTVKRLRSRPVRFVGVLELNMSFVGRTVPTLIFCSIKFYLKKTHNDNKTTSQNIQVFIYKNKSVSQKDATTMFTDGLLVLFPGRQSPSGTTSRLTCKQWSDDFISVDSVGTPCHPLCPALGLYHLKCRTLFVLVIEATWNTATDCECASSL
jgi:hypothetical protein